MYEHPCVATAVPTPVRDVLVVERPDQLKALGHPLRLRILETLGGGDAEQLTNRELAQRLDVDPGHLHFHVRMLLKAELIAPAAGGHGREKPYRAAARTIRVSDELLSSGAADSVQGAMLEEVQRARDEFAATGRFRSAQLTVRVPVEQMLELLEELFEKASRLEDRDEPPVVLTALIHPRSSSA